MAAKTSERLLSISQDMAVVERGPKITDFLLAQNAGQEIEHFQQDKNIQWASFLDYSQQHPESLSGYLVAFMQTQDAPIFEVFPIRLSKEARFQWTEIRSKTLMPDAGVRKVPHRQISFQTATKSASAVYTGEGFSVDYTHLRSPEGMGFFNLNVSRITSDIWSMIIHSAMHECHSTPSEYVHPDQLYPHDQVPTRVAELFAYERPNFGMLNKKTQAIQNLIALGNRIFERNGTKAARILMSVDCANFITTRDDTQKWYDMSGNQALANRSAGSAIASVHNVRVIPVHMLEPKLHSDYTDNVLRTEVVTGSMATFIEPSQNVLAKDHLSTDRNLKMASWTSDRVEEYDFRDFLHHCPEFYPLDAENCREDQRGGLNEKLLLQLAGGTNGGDYDKVSMLFGTMHTRLRGNEEQLHQFLKYVRPSKTDMDQRGSWHLIRTYGEIAECHLKSRYLELPYRTMEHAILQGLTLKDREAIVSGVELAVFLSTKTPIVDTYLHLRAGSVVGRTGHPVIEDVDKDTLRTRYNGVPYGLGSIGGLLALYDYHVAHGYDGVFDKAVMTKIVQFVPAFEKLVTRMCEVNKGHPALDPRNVPDYYDSPDITDFTKTMIACWSLLVHQPDAFVNEYKAGATPSSEPQYVGMRFESHEAPMSFEGYRHLVERYFRQIGGQSTPFARHYLDIKLGKRDDVLLERLEEVSTRSLFSRMAARAVLLQEINLKGIDSWHANNVAIPLGGILMRPFESQLMEHVVLFAEGDVGNTYFAGMDNTLSFDQGFQHLWVQAFTHFRVIIKDRRKMLILPNVRGVQLMGGKGNRYINDDMLNRTRIVETGTQLWNDTVNENFGSGERMGDYSIFPVLQPYNASIDAPFAERHLDARGYWDRWDFLTRMHYSPDFQETMPRPMYANQSLVNMLFPQFTRRSQVPLSEISERASFDEVSGRRRVNHHIHQCTQFVKDPISHEWQEIVASHPWGREVDGLVGVQNSTTTVKRTS